MRICIRFQMFIYIKQLNSPGATEIQLDVCVYILVLPTKIDFQVSPLDTIQEIKSRLAEQLNIPINQQKLVLKGKPLHDGSLRDYQISDGSKLHLIVSTQNSTNKPINDTFINELRLLASKWIVNPNEREAFVIAFQTVKSKINSIRICFLFSRK